MQGLSSEYIVDDLRVEELGRNDAVVELVETEVLEEVPEMPLPVIVVPLVDIEVGV